MNISNFKRHKTYLSSSITFTDEDNFQYLLSIVADASKKCTNISCVLRSDLNSFKLAPYYILVSKCPEEFTFKEVQKLVPSCTTIRELKERLFLY